MNLMKEHASVIFYPEICNFYNYDFNLKSAVNMKNNGFVFFLALVGLKWCLKLALFLTIIYFLNNEKQFHNS